MHEAFEWFLDNIYKNLPAEEKPGRFAVET